MVFQPKIYFEGNIAKENCSLFLKILCFFQLGGWAWAYIRNEPNAAASIAGLLNPALGNCGNWKTGETADTGELRKRGKLGKLKNWGTGETRVNGEL